MIELSLTHDQMLTRIGASEFDLTCELENPADPRFATLESFRFVAVKRTRGELLGALCAGLEARYPKIAPEQLILDLSRPIKKALGNAYKRGNCGDPEKRIRVEIAFTPAGAVSKISDEGEGFDVSAIWDGFRNGEVYFNHHGGGFVTFESARSRVSYADGGRTFLLCFQLDADPARCGHPELGLAADEKYMARVLGEELNHFKKGKAQLESCRAFIPATRRSADPEIRYALQYSKDSGKTEKSAVLTGRLLSPELAEADFENAKALYSGPFKPGKGVLIPRPHYAFKQHPRLSLFAFDPTRDLRDLFDATRDPDRLRKAGALVGTALRTLHHSSAEVGGIEPLDELRERGLRNARRVAGTLREQAGEEAEEVGEFLARIGEDLGILGAYEPMPIHGAFGWHCVLCQGEDLYLQYFEICRRSHPGIDVGAFLADLLDFASDGARTDCANTIRGAFFGAYFGGAPHPSEDDTSVFVRMAILDRAVMRIDRGQGEWLSEIARISRDARRL